jgi:hypothetical protein
MTVEKDLETGEDWCESLSDTIDDEVATLDHAAESSGAMATGPRR